VVIRATLRVEGCFNRSQGRSEAEQHRFEHVIAPHAQAVADDFDLGVTIAKMPSDASQRGGVLGRDFDERFAFSDDAHHRSIFKY
jgi:hypothetical protein